MQKLRAIHKLIFRFLPIHQLPVRLGCLLLVLGLHTGTSAQIVPAPAPASPAPTQPSVTPGRVGPGVTPATAPGRFDPNTGQPLPATRTNPANGQPGRTAPANTQPGRTGNQPTTGRTTTPTNPTGPTGPGFEQNANEDANNNVQDIQALTAEQQFEAARNQERVDTQRKLFGNSLFTNPANAATFQPNLRIATPRNYNIGPDDQLQIRIYGNSEVDFSQTVSPEGNLYFGQQTGIGPVNVSGLSIEQARSRIEARLSQRYIGLKNSQYGVKNTFLELSLGNIRSIRVTAVGDVIRPGTYTISSLSTAMNAIYGAGGPNDIGSFRNVSIIRNNRLVATIDLYDYLLNGTLRNDIRMQDNDNIRFNTYKTRVEVTGSTKRNNIFELLPGENLGRVLAYAGGFAPTAYKSRVQVTRLTDKEVKVIDVPANDFDGFGMQDGDKVSVTNILDRYENQVTVSGAVFRPGNYALNQSPTLKTLIATADGLKGDAFTGRVYIIRTREDLVQETIALNLADILSGVQPDVPLKREDLIQIPSKFDLAEQATVSLVGDVVNPQGNPLTFPYSANMTIEDLLLRAGGLKESAAASQIEIVRRRKDVDPRSKTAQIADVIRLDINRDLSLGAGSTGFVLQPFDEVIVRRSANYYVQTFVTIDGEVVMAGRYALRSKGQKVSDLIAEAGGLTPQAYVPGATLLRLVILSPDEVAAKQRAIDELANDSRKSVVEIESAATVKTEAIGINLRKILDNPGSSEDILIQSGDVLRVPKLLETVRVQGEVLLPTTIKYRGGQTFQDYISQSGGFTEQSLRRRSYIVYANGSVDRTRKFLFFNVYPRVEPGSEVIVPRQARNPLTPLQILSQTAGIASGLLGLISTILLISRIK